MKITTLLAPALLLAAPLLAQETSSEKTGPSAPAKAALTVSDADVVAAQKPSYPLKTCVIGGDELGIGRGVGAVGGDARLQREGVAGVAGLADDVEAEPGAVADALAVGGGEGGEGEPGVVGGAVGAEAALGEDAAAGEAGVGRVGGGGGTFGHQRRRRGGGVGALAAGEAEERGGGGGAAAVAGVVKARRLGVEDAEPEAVGEVGGDADEEALDVVGVAFAGRGLGAVDDEEGRGLGEGRGVEASSRMYGNSTRSSFIMCCSSSRASAPNRPSICASSGWRAPCTSSSLLRYAEMRGSAVRTYAWCPSTIRSTS